MLCYVMLYENEYLYYVMLYEDEYICYAILYEDEYVCYFMLYEGEYLCYVMLYEDKSHNYDAMNPYVNLILFCFSHEYANIIIRTSKGYQPPDIKAALLSE